MHEDTLAKIEANAAYRRLIRRRSRLGWLLATIVFLAYFGFIAVIAFDKKLLATPIGSGLISIGIPVGFGIILLTILLTGIYVMFANGEFDRLTHEITAEVEA